MVNDIILQLYLNDCIFGLLSLLSLVFYRAYTACSTDLENKHCAIK